MVYFPVQGTKGGDGERSSQMEMAVPLVQVWSFPSLCFASDLVPSKYHRTDHTPDITDYAQETIKLKSTGNFISHHTGECTSRPPTNTLARFEESKKCILVGEEPLPLADDEKSALEKREEMWRRFDEEGRRNPIKKVMKESYREHLSLTIYEDDLPLSHAEGGGTLKLLTHLLPSGIKACVSHQTIMHDGKVINKLIDEEIMRRIKVRFTVYLFGHFH
jgi:hypothetical protein